MRAVRALAKRVVAKDRVVTMASKPPRVRLKEIIDRSGYSGSKLAKMLGYASPPGLLRYMQDKQGDKPIPFDVVQKLTPFLRGRGTPAISAEELLALTDAADIPKPVEKAFVSIVDDADGFLTVQYRIESGVYVKVGTRRSLGAARIGVSKEFPSASQFVVAVGEDLEGVGKSGSQLHCVTQDQFSQFALLGRRVVVAVPLDAKSDIAELKVATVSKSDANGTLLHDLTGMPADGTIIGVVIGMYVRL